MGLGPAHKPSLVIFDCDGVLVDTERMTNAFMAKFITDKGFPITGAESRRRFVGLRLSSLRAKLLEEDGVDLGDEFVQRVYEELPRLFAQGVDAIPHVETVVDALKVTGVPWCVASSGEYAKMRLTLGSSGLLPLFEDVLFSAYDVERGKPHPDLFLHAAKSMGHETADCVVIEDSAFGVQAGVAAGMHVFAYCGDEASDPEKLKAAGGEVFYDMRDLPTLLGL